MSTYADDDALIAKGTRILTRPGLTLIPAPSVAQPSATPTNTHPPQLPTTGSNTPQPNPTQPQPSVVDNGDALVPAGTHPQSRPGITLMPAPAVLGTGGRPAGASSGGLAPNIPPSNMNPRQPQSGASSSTAQELGSTPALVGPPGDYDGWYMKFVENYNKAQDPVLQADLKSWVAQHWSGPAFTPIQWEFAATIARQWVYTDSHNRLVTGPAILKLVEAAHEGSSRLAYDPGPAVVSDVRGQISALSLMVWQLSAGYYGNFPGSLGHPWK